MRPKNWKTTICAIVAAVASFVSFSPQTFGGENNPFVQFCKFVSIGGLVSFGVVAKDYNVSGNSK